MHKNYTKNYIYLLKVRMVDFTNFIKNGKILIKLNKSINKMNCIC